MGGGATVCSVFYVIFRARAIRLMGFDLLYNVSGNVEAEEATDKFLAKDFSDGHG